MCFSYVLDIIGKDSELMSWQIRIRGNPLECKVLTNFTVLKVYILKSV